jgi:hypothetical protein
MIHDPQVYAAALAEEEGALRDGRSGAAARAGHRTSARASAAAEWVIEAADRALSVAAEAAGVDEEEIQQLLSTAGLELLLGYKVRVVVVVVVVLPVW